MTTSQQGGDSFSQILETQLASLTVLYTAQRTVEARGLLISTYAGSQYSANIIIPTVAESLQKKLPQNGAHLIRLLKDVYDPSWLDRGRGLLPIVQSVVSERLQPTPAEDAFEVFVRSAETLENSIELQWQSVFENKLAAYFAQVKILEEHIGSTVASISQQIAEMIKGLSDTMLAAVATILGTLIASLFTDKFNASLFITGMIVYGLYVLAFPLSYNMSARWGNYKAVAEDYDKRRANFERQITLSKIKEIEGSRIENRKKSFLKWFWITIGTYSVVIILVLITAWQASVPGSFVMSILASTTAPSAMPASNLVATPTSLLSLSPTGTPARTPSPTFTPVIAPAIPTPTP